LEILISSYLILFFSRSSIIAIILGAIVLTIFSYVVLLFYLQAKKPAQINELQQSFISACRHAVSVPEGLAEHHLSVANALMKLSYYLYGIEYGYFTSALNIDFLKSLCERISGYLHQEDVFKMQESLLFRSIDEHVTQIKNTPTDLELHVSLAHGYVSLAKLYLDGQKKSLTGAFFKKNKTVLEKKFEIASKRAIDEFIILKEFAPNDPWIHAQLAQCYHSMEMYEDEANEHEAMLELSPNDGEIKFRLARIYFTLGRNAEGLQVYEGLKKEGYKKADELLCCYASVNALEEMEAIY
jgi:tetratricopeptide (TPR) repeat protein